MQPEFDALGVDRKLRGQLTDETIDFIRDCFDTPDDIVSANGQPFLFRPRPSRPPIYVGGMTDAALSRTLRCGDGWLPMGIDPEKLAPRVQRLREMERPQRPERRACFFSRCPCFALSTGRPGPPRFTQS